MYTVYKCVYTRNSFFVEFAHFYKSLFQERKKVNDHFTNGMGSGTRGSSGNLL